MAVNDEGNKLESKVKKATLWSFVQGICTVLFVIFILFKFYNSTFQVDFSTLLSIILAIFSIWLSATFYFKATETSNLFYQNTYVHSKDIATLLSKIESGFGEKLNNLNTSYLGIIDRIQNPAEQREKIKNEMTKETEEIEKIKQSKDKIINELIQKANLVEKERKEIRVQLLEKENNLKMAENNISNLKNELSLLNNNEIDLSQSGAKVFFNYFSNYFYPRLLKNEDGSSNDSRNLVRLENRFRELIDNNSLDSIFVKDGIRYGYFTADGELSDLAKRRLIKLSRETLN